MYLAGNLKFLREQIGKTQQELANLFGVEQKTMSSWECGSRTPGIEIIVELARYHGVSLDDLVLRDMKPAMPVYVLNLMDFVATEKWRGQIDGKIVRVHYSCTAENSKALNKATLERELLEDGAFMVWEILPDKIDEFANRTQEKEPEPKPLTEEQREERARKFEEIRRKILGGEAE